MNRKKKTLALTSSEQCNELNSVIARESPALALWLSQCPDPKAYHAALAEFVWLQQVVDCYECGEELPRAQLRYDVACPCGDPSRLICRSCWESYNSGTLGNPSYRAPQWPKKLTRQNVERLTSGKIISHGKCIGRADGYNYRGHFAQKVTLDGFEDCAEGGALEPHWVVVVEDE